MTDVWLVESPESLEDLLPFVEMKPLMGLPAMQEFERRHGLVDRGKADR